MMKLTPAQEQACESLKDILARQQEGKVNDDISLAVDRETCMAFDDNELEDLEDEEYEDLDENEQESIEGRPDLVEDGLQRCILNLLISLFTHLPSGTDNKFYSPIFRFLVLFSLKKNGQWLAGRRITQLFAALLFCGREVMMALMHSVVTQSSGRRYSE